MIIIGLTGSIGMGKSATADMVRRMGVPVFDADAVVHSLQSAGGDAVAAIAAAFPGTTSVRGVDRNKLGAAVFNNTTALKILEAILHPLVRQAQDCWLAMHRRRRSPKVVLDIPLLFEKGGWRLCDCVIVVSAPAHVQRARVLARPGMTADRLAAILAKQMPDWEKRRRADYVLHTALGKRLTSDALKRLLHTC